jgi:hypothetical protein
MIHTMIRSRIVLIGFGLISLVVFAWAMNSSLESRVRVVSPKVREQNIQAMKAYLSRKDAFTENLLASISSPFSMDRTRMSTDIQSDPFLEGEQTLLQQIAHTIVPKGVVIGPRGGVMHVGESKEVSVGSDWVVFYKGLQYVVTLVKLEPDGFTLRYGNETFKQPFSLSSKNGVTRSKKP